MEEFIFIIFVVLMIGLLSGKPIYFSYWHNGINQQYQISLIRQ